MTFKLKNIKGYETERNAIDAVVEISFEIEYDDYDSPYPQWDDFAVIDIRCHGRSYNFDALSNRHQAALKKLCFSALIEKEGEIVAEFLENAKAAHDEAMYERMNHV